MEKCHAWTNVIAFRVSKMSTSNKEQYVLKSKRGYQARSDHRTSARKVGKINKLRYRYVLYKDNDIVALCVPKLNISDKLPLRIPMTR